MTAMAFAQELSERMDAEGLSVQALAEQIRVSAQTVRNWLYQGRVPGTTYMRRVADRFGLSMDEVSRWEDKPEVETPPADPQLARVRSLLREAQEADAQLAQATAAADSARAAALGAIQEALTALERHQASES